MYSASAPTLEEWRDLYQGSRSFLERRPWDWLSDSQLIAVEEPDTKEVAYCCILGAGGMQYGLLAYRGTTGIQSYAMLANGALDEDEALLVADCLNFYLGDREMLLPEDREVHKALNLRFRGRGAWPIFRSNRPGFLPVLPTGQEARFLSACLEQTCALIQEASSGLPLPKLPSGSALIARRRNRNGNWETTSLPLPPLSSTPPLEVDELRLQRLRRELPRARQTWEAAVQVVAPIAEKGAAPYWAWLLMCVDQKTGFILAANVIGPEATVQGQLLSTVELAGLLPEEIRVTSGLLESQLTPIAGVLGIKLRRAKRLRELERASKSMKGAFGGP